VGVLLERGGEGAPAGLFFFDAMADLAEALVLCVPHVFGWSDENDEGDLDFCRRVRAADPNALLGTDVGDALSGGLRGVAQTIVRWIGTWEELQQGTRPTSCEIRAEFRAKMSLDPEDVTDEPIKPAEMDAFHEWMVELTI
jgi:hypothetical protein